jgi:hypothetical protein
VVICSRKAGSSSFASLACRNDRGGGMGISSCGGAKTKAADRALPELVEGSVRSTWAHALQVRSKGPPDECVRGYVIWLVPS